MPGKQHGNSAQPAPLSHTLHHLCQPEATATSLAPGWWPPPMQWGGVQWWGCDLPCVGGTSCRSTTTAPRNCLLQAPSLQHRPGTIYGELKSLALRF